MKISLIGKQAVARNSRMRLLALAVAFIFLSSLTLFSQEATIVGTVTDTTGAVLPNVTITLTNTDTGITRTIKSNDAGEYVVPDLHIGRYIAKAEGTGFSTAEKTGIVLTVGDRLRVDFAMKVGVATELVTVEANAVAVQADSGEVSSMITGGQISQLATNGRSVFALEALTPGASGVQGDFMLPTSAGGDFNVSFNGQRMSHNLWLIDGGEAADRGGGGGADVSPSMDAISEFRTMTSNYSAEYGLSSAGTMTMVIKSGTKRLHATAFYFGRNDALDARNYINRAPSPIAELRFHDWGFNVGGPVSFHPNKSTPKTFFFYNMEWRRYISGGIFNVTAPYANTYGGNFATNLPADLLITNPSSADYNKPIPHSGLHTPCASQLSAALQTAWQNAGITFSTPTAGGSCSPDQQGTLASQPTFQQFPSNAIPTALLDANAAALLGAGIFPKPNSGTQFIGGSKQPTTGKEELVRIDHQFTDKLSVFGHFVADQVLQTYGQTMWSGENSPTVGNTFGNPSYHAVIHGTYMIHPNLLNEVAYNYNGNRINILNQGVYKAPAGFTFNRIFSGPNALNRIPQINLNGSTGLNYNVNWVPWRNVADDYQVRDDLSWVTGSHQFKFGASWSIYKKVQDYFAATQGAFAFNGSLTGYDFADFLAGFAQGYGENAYKGTGHWNALSPAAYIQDNWRATNRLTLNLGLRWDGIPHTYEANQNHANFYPNLYDSSKAPIWVAGSNYGQIASNSPGLGASPLSALQGYQFYLNGMGIGGKNGLPKGLANDAWWNFGPRVGFAYDVTGSGKTIVRGGFGLMYERIQGNDMYNGATNPPFGYTLGTNNVLLGDPHNTWTGGTVTVPIVPAGVVGINRDYPASRVFQYSVGVQQAVGSRAVFSASYVGNQSRNLSYWQELNLPPANLLPCLTAGNCPAGTAAFNGLVKYQGYSSIRQAFNGAEGHYNSLQTELHGQVTRDLNLQAAYTYAKGVDPSSGNGGNGWDLNWVTNPYAGWKYDNGPSPLDRTHVAYFTFVYDIPLLKNSSHRAAKALVGGWQLSGIVLAESGPVLNIGLSGQNVSSIFPGGDTNNRPDLVGKISYPKTVNKWFDTAAFARPQDGLWGNLGHNALRGPGRQNWNLSLFKSFMINEERGTRFEFRAESFNTWNHTQFGAAGAGGNGGNGVSANYGANNFGAITAAYDPRVFQLGAKLIF